MEQTLKLYDTRDLKFMMDNERYHLLLIQAILGLYSKKESYQITEQIDDNRVTITSV